jgi:hypothetical protein
MYSVRDRRLEQEWHTETVDYPSHQRMKCLAYFLPVTQNTSKFSDTAEACSLKKDKMHIQMYRYS